MPKHGYVPLRTCLGCGQRDAQSHLIRLTAQSDGHLGVADSNGRGRGGYLHKTASCWQEFARKKSHYRAFHMELSKNAKAALIQALQARDRE